jgi:hypothetical protein
MNIEQPADGWKLPLYFPASCHPTPANSLFIQTPPCPILCRTHTPLQINAILRRLICIAAANVAEGQPGASGCGYAVLADVGEDLLLFVLCFSGLHLVIDFKLFTFDFEFFQTIHSDATSSFRKKNQL